jgi:3-oxoacyl-[acyl-carrier-protein] synthase III
MVWKAVPLTNGNSAGGSSKKALRERFLRKDGPLALRRAVLTGTGSALPSRVVSNDEFPLLLETCDEWIRTRTGIRERRIAGPDESSSTLGLKAAREAVASAGLSPRDIDLIICATVTPDTMVPSNACRVQGGLGCRPIGAFDVAGACTGFVQAISIANQFIGTGACQNILVLGAEVLSRTLDYHDRKSCILFGDGAGAVVLSASGEAERGIRWIKVCSDGTKGDLIHMPSNVTHRPPPLLEQSLPDAPGYGKHLQLNGREVFKFAVRTMISLVREAMASVKLSSPDRLFLVPHQVNQRIIDAALEELPIPTDRVVINLDRYGNTSAASIPIALDETMRSHAIGPGDHLLLVAFGGGMTWGGTVISL